MKQFRPDPDEYFVAMALLVATRGSCSRRRVGCVLVNNRRHVIATGYNGPASGMPNCISRPCAGASLPSGTGLDVCEAIHAEQNALIQCERVHEIDTVYCTTAPCISCVKMIMNTGAKRIVFWEDYPHSEASRVLWLKHRLGHDTEGLDTFLDTQGTFWKPFPRPDLRQEWNGSDNLACHMVNSLLRTYSGKAPTIGLTQGAQDTQPEPNLQERRPAPAVRARLDVGTSEARRLDRLQKQGGKPPRGGHRNS